MQYKIKNTMIPIPVSHEQPLLATLAMYDRGESLTDSPLIKSRINLTHMDVYRADDKEVALQERQKVLIALYEDIKANGYNGSNILVWFDDDGFIHLYDGYHRLAIMKHLGMAVDVNAETSWNGIGGVEGRDFPLAETLVLEPPEGKWLYQPVDDDRLKGWELGRSSTPERLNHIAQSLVGETVLDIGCSEGYFSRELAKRGYKVTAIDRNKGLVASARYLSIIGSVEVDYHLVDDWKSFVDQNGSYDNILLLNVIHNDMKVIGVEEGLKKLEALRGKANRIFLEAPYHVWGEASGKHGFTGEPPLDFSAEESVKRLEVAIGSKAAEKWLHKPGSRPIYTFGNGSRLILGSKVSEEDLVYEPDVNGYPMYLFKDERWITPCLIKYHKAEAVTTDYVKNQLKPGQTFVDVGAHIGYYTVLASKMVGRDGKVYAFEPSASNFEVLIRNVQMNKCSNVVVINKALSDKTGWSKLYKMDAISHGELYLKEGLVEDRPLGSQSYMPRNILAKNDYEEIETVRLDEILSTPPEMIKVDVEGSEMLVLKGMGELLEKPSDMAMLVEDFTGESVKYLSDKFGFSAVGKADRWNNVLRRTQQTRWSLEQWIPDYRNQYWPLFNSLRHKPCRNIMEVGTHNGNNAVAMIKTAAQKVPEDEIHYYGFDLFEEKTKAAQEYEFSPVTMVNMREVKAHIEKHTKADVTLVKGNTRKTLGKAVKSLPMMDLIYIDGGHSTETTRNDWQCASKLMDKGTVVYFDDYNDEMPFIGAYFIVGELDPKYYAEVLPATNYYKRPFGRLKSQLLRVTIRKPKATLKTEHFRFHLMSLPHSKTVKNWGPCAFTMLTHRFCQMMMDLGHEVYHYGTEGSNPVCTEHIDVLTEAVQKQAYGDWDPYKQLFIHNGNDLAYRTFRKNAIEELNRRKEPGDILLISNGSWLREISDKAGQGIITVEPFVGYLGCYSKFKVFPSYAWMHHLYGKMSRKPNNENFVIGGWYDAVIQHFFNPDDYTFEEKKEDYFLYLGRLIRRKGIHIAVDLCKRIGAKLYVAGQPLYPDRLEWSLKHVGIDGPNVEYLGVLDEPGMDKWRSKAKALIAPSIYIEPFGMIVPEASFSGTPVITTDWGAFPETVKQGETGYRCRTMDDFIWAANNVDKIDPKACREYAVNNFSMERIGKAYHEYFTKIHDLSGKGWYAEHPDRTDLDWIKRY